MGQEQGVAISIAGGLDKTSSSFDLFKTPGAATRLKNFEASIHGGYRRVDGYWIRFRNNNNNNGF